MDLFTPVVPEIKWHPYFARLIHRPNKWIEAVLNDWATDFEDRDGKFVREFQTTFDSCFWELFLNAVLRGRGLRPNFAVASPDFVMEESPAFTVEATVASHAKGQPPEHSSLERSIPTDLNAFSHDAMLRIANAITTKRDKFKSHYASLPHVAGNPFVIAITAFDRPNFWLSCQRPVEAVLYNYYVDEEVWRKSLQSPAPISSIQLVTKSNGKSVDLGYFQNDSMADVSAVIFSTCAAWGKVSALSDDPHPDTYFTAIRLNPHSTIPHIIRAQKSNYAESLLDGLRVYHNPFAKFPLDPSIFRDNDVFQLYFRHDSGEWVAEQTEGQLLARFTFRLERRASSGSKGMDRICDTRRVGS
jgi:hypothetical protein